MPQMAPSMWSLMFLLFLLSYMMYMTLIYFFNIYKPKTSQEKKSVTTFKNWKW